MGTLRVLARPGVVIDFTDEAGRLIKWRKITETGLLCQEQKRTIEGPVEVPCTDYYEHLIRHGDLLVAEPVERKAPRKAAQRADVASAREE